jgi:signal transduction histidine kinase
MKAMSTRLWQFVELPSKITMAPMDEEETRLAQRMTAALPSSVEKLPVMVQLHQSPAVIPERQLPVQGDLKSEAIQVYLPVDPHTTLSAVFLRAPAGWPVEIIVAALVAILVASLGATMLARRVVRPLSELTAASSVVARGGVPPHVEEKGPDDVRNAAIAFNKMTGEVTRTLESQRHLLSAVGHDLRTPITAMRINLEFIEEDDLRERLLGNLEELQALTEQVLSAARGAGGESKRNVDLSALVESLIADLDDMGEPVTWQNHDPAPVTCRPNEIRRAVRNLVENAVAYGARAEVQIAESADGYDVVVEDDGPGIPDNDRLRVFEPFVRLEGSRNAATGGTGLGLTLVKSIVEGHGGAIILENRESGGLRARMHLPRMAVSA